MGADLTQGMLSLPGTRQSAQITARGRAFHIDFGAPRLLRRMVAVTSTVMQQTGGASPTRRARTFQVRTYGCQMNVHDSERLSGLLEAAGYRRAVDGSDADVVVFNTCAVRENADNKLYGNLSHLAPRKQADPHRQIAVGGCLAQTDRETVLR